MSRRTPIRVTPHLPRWHARALYAAFAAVAGSGAVWLWLHHYGQIAGEFGVQPHPAEPAMLVLHGLGAIALLVLLGALIPLHIRAGLRTRRNRTAGIALAGGMVLLAGGGGALYYVGSETLRPLLSLAHWGLGLAVVLLFGWHALRGRQQAGSTAEKSAAKSPLQG
jgi:hypothetical protein